MKVVVFLVAMLLVGFGAFAEEAELTLTDPSFWEPIVLDFGRPLPDINLVQVEFAGLGGHQCISFNSIGNEETVFFSFVAKIDLESGSIYYQAPIDEAYATSQVLILPDGGEWESLADGVGSIQISPFHTGPTTNNYSIIACGYDPFTIDTLTVTVSYGSTVPVAVNSWGALKVLYR